MSQDDSVLLSVSELSETNEYVLVKFVEFVNNKVVETLAKGIKDLQGDIIDFIDL